MQHLDESARKRQKIKDTIEEWVNHRFTVLVQRMKTTARLRPRLHGEFHTDDGQTNYISKYTLNVRNTVIMQITLFYHFTSQLEFIRISGRSVGRSGAQPRPTGPTLPPN